MRKFISITITLIMAVTSCRSVDISEELHKNDDINELYDTFNDYHNMYGYWPSKQTWDSLKISNNKLKKFSKLDFKSHHDTLKMILELEYMDYQNVFRTIKMKPVIEPSGLLLYNVTDIKLQPDIQLEVTDYGDKIHGVEQIWIKTKLTATQKSKLRKWQKGKKIKN